MYETMKKKLYIEPKTYNISLATEQLMITASPGVGDGYDPGAGIDSKGSNFFEEDEEEEDEPQYPFSVWKY
jgi:hypothetical protein